MPEINISNFFSTKEHSLIIQSKIDETKQFIEKNKVDEKDITPLFINNYIEKINKMTDNIVVDYNYEIIDKTKINFIVLLKHIFKKFGEPQKYFKGTMFIHENHIEIKRNDKIKLSLSSKLSSSIELLYIHSMKVTNSIEEDGIHNATKVEFQTDDDIANYKNFDVIYLFIKKLINKIYIDIYNV